VARLFALLLLVCLAPEVWGFSFIINEKTGLPIKWNPGQVTMRVLLGSTSTLIDGSNYNTSTQVAAETWNAVLGNFKFNPQLAAAAEPTDRNRVNEMAFAADIFGKAFGDTTLAVTTTWYSGNRRTESDIVFNTKYTWDSYRGVKRTGIVDLQRVAIHELGHSLGLDHPDEDAQTVNAVMNSRVSTIDTITSDDTDGAQNLYGPLGIPANDKFANALAVVLSNGAAKVTGYNTNATKETGEPRHADNAGGHSVWWKWTAPSSGAITIDTRGSYSDTTLGIYTGTALASLIKIASNDDIDEGVVQASTVTFNAVGGTIYYLAVDGFDADSSGLTLNLNSTTIAIGSAPTITTQPESKTVTAGTSVSFSVVATGNPTPTYQWQKGVNGISGATAATYTIASPASGDAGSYTVTVSNSIGAVTSSAATLTVNTLPAITTQPASATATAGTNVVFSVTATAGTNSIAYQWLLANVALTGATSSSLSLSNVQTNNAGDYTVKLTTTAGSVTSTSATLTVTPAPVVVPPSPAPTSGGGGGGGGAPSLWFGVVLSGWALGRYWRRRIA
jgi:hypothetical protein